MQAECEGNGSDSAADGADDSNYESASGSAGVEAQPEGAISFAGSPSAELQQRSSDDAAQLATPPLMGPADAGNEVGLCLDALQ